MQVSPQQVYQEVLGQGGSQLQASVAAALVDGIESNGDPTELAGGIGPAQGLFQFEPGTWQGAGGGTSLPATVAAASWQQQVTAFLNESGGPGGSNFGAWGPDLGAGNGVWNWSGGPAAGSAVANKIAGLNLPGGGGAAPVGSSSGAAQPQTATTAAAAGPQSSTNIGGVTYPGTQQQTSALSTLEANLGTYGFSPDQVKQLTGWAWGEITNNVDPTQIAIDLQAQPAFQQQFPGFAPANAALQAKGLQAVSVQQYMQYQTQAVQAAQAAGLPPGFLNSGNIGFFVGNNVSMTELTSRMNDAMVLGYQSTPEQQQMFNQYFGVSDSDAYLGYNLNGQGGITPGQIAALALDPLHAEPLIKQQILAAQIGGAASTAGIGAIDQATATSFAQTNPSLTQGQIQSALGQVAPYAPLETALPGVHGVAALEGMVSPDLLLGTQLQPTTGNLRQLQVAEETRKAPFAGGGGFVSSTKGAVGTGSAAPTGSPSGP